MRLGIGRGVHHDVLTPQLFVTAILLDAPIVLSSLTRSSRFTYGLVAAALVANIVAGHINGVSDHDHWDPLGIGDRVCWRGSRSSSSGT